QDRVGCVKRTVERPVRFTHPTIFVRLVLEKLPLFLLAAASCVVTPLTQGAAVVRLEMLPLPVRAANAVAAYVTYLGQFVCPVNLSAAYPHRGVDLPGWKVAVAGLLLAGISASA